MTLPKLWQIAKDRFTNEQIQDIWDNRKTIELINPLNFLKKVRDFSDFFVVGPYIHLDIMYNHEKSIY